MKPELHLHMVGSQLVLPVLRIWAFARQALRLPDQLCPNCTFQAHASRLIAYVVRISPAEP